MPTLSNCLVTAATISKYSSSNSDTNNSNNVWPRLRHDVGLEEGEY